MKPTSNILDRWAQFDIEGCSLALFNQMYDYQAIAGGQNLEKRYNKPYLSRLSKHKTVFGNKVVLRLRAKDLEKERARILALEIGTVSDILYVNISEPYYFFMLTDPDGNLLEITGANSAPTSSPEKSEENEVPSKEQSISITNLEDALEKKKLHSLRS